MILVHIAREFDSDRLHWVWVALTVVLAVALLPIVGRLLGVWPPAKPQRLFVTFDPCDATQALTLSVVGKPIRKVSISGFDAPSSAVISMEPTEVSFLHPDRSARGSVIVKQLTAGENHLITLAYLLEKRRNIQVFAHFIDEEGRRKYIPFTVKKVGPHHEIICMAGREASES